MNIEMLRHFFAWCAVINYAMLLLWFVLHLGVHGFLTGLCERFFGIDAQSYDKASLKGMLYLKLAIWVFNIGPYLALRIMA